METDFKQIVKRKTKDELVRIVINKEEYKNELVDAATEELKSREKEKATGAIEYAQPIVATSTERDTPFGIYFAGILLLLTGPIWFAIGLMQAGVATIADDTTTGLYSIWNTLFAVISIVFGIGILKGKKWGYEWGLGTACLNLVWFGYLSSDTQNMFIGFLALLELTIAVMLYINRGYFDTEPRIERNVIVKTPDSYENLSKEERENIEYKQDLVHINTLIREHKRGIRRSPEKIGVHKSIEKLCPTKETAIYLLKVYQQLFKVDLIEDLKGLSNSYDGIKAHCKMFIDFGIVSKDYPHERLNKKINNDPS